MTPEQADKFIELLENMIDDKVRDAISYSNHRNDACDDTWMGGSFFSHIKDEMKTLLCSNRKVTLKEVYTNGDCPDCYKAIPDSLDWNEPCPNCGHIFSFPG